MARFARAVGREGDYGELWRWSVDDLEGFWGAVWEFFDVQAPSPTSACWAGATMPGAEWFPGSRLSYAEHFFRGRDDDTVAIHHASELRELSQWTWGELREQTARVAAGLRAAGRGPGRPRRGVHAEHPETHRGLPGHGLDRRGVVQRGPGVRRASGDRSLRADRAEGAAGDRRLPLRRERPRSQRRRRAASPRRSAGRLVRFGYLDGSGWPQDLVADEEPLVFEQVPFDAPAVAAVQLRNDRAAQADRPQPGRDPARAPEVHAPARRRAGGRSGLLVHHDGLDDVELPRRRAADRRPRSCSTTAIPACPISACCGTWPSARA